MLTVVYAPPGSEVGGAASSVTYGRGSTAGSTVGASNSFKQSYTVTATGSGGLLGTGSLGASFGYTGTRAGNSTLDIQKSTASEINVVGPGQNGIDHDQDQIWILLEPRIRLSLTDTSVSWTFEPNQQDDIQIVYVKHLKNPSLMPTGVANQLQAHGITENDYPQILQADPFANGPSIPDPERYAPLYTTFPYEPPPVLNGSVTTFKVTLTSSSTQTTSTSAQNEYSVGMTAEGGVKFGQLLEATLKADASWTWTSENTKATSNIVSESAAVTIGSPSFGYRGETDLAVYYDRLYKTFLFTPVVVHFGTATPMTGRLTSRSGRTVSGQEVDVTDGQRTYRTFTNAKGEYRFFQQFVGPITISSGGVSKTIPRPGAREDLEIP